MKVHFSSRIALLYNESLVGRDALQEILVKNKIQLRIVEQDSLSLSVAALAGYADSPVPEKGYEGAVPTGSCLVFSGVDEAVLERVLTNIREEELVIDYKAVVTPINRNWAFGYLMQELEKEKQAVKK